MPLYCGKPYSYRSDGDASDSTFNRQDKGAQAQFGRRQVHLVQFVEDNVHAAVIYGQDAFGCISLGTKSKPNFRLIVKAPGSSGSLEPLDQRGSVAWKVPFFCGAILQDDFIVRLEYAVSA